MATTVARIDALDVGVVDPFVETQPVMSSTEHARIAGIHFGRPRNASSPFRIGYLSSPRSIVPPPRFPFVGFKDVTRAGLTSVSAMSAPTSARPKTSYGTRNRGSP